MVLKLWLQPRDGGLFPINNEGEEALAAITANEVECTIKATDIRSPDEHKLFFAIISEAFKSWPFLHYFRPFSKEHLRAWLLCEAGYCTTTIYMVRRPYGEIHDFGHNGGPALDCDAAEIEETSNMGELVVRVTNAIRGVKQPIVEEFGDVIRVRIPKSVAWHRLGQKRFHQYVKAVSDVLVNEIGVSIDDLKKLKEAA